MKILTNRVRLKDDRIEQKRNLSELWFKWFNEDYDEGWKINREYLL